MIPRISPLSYMRVNAGEPAYKRHSARGAEANSPLAFVLGVMAGTIPAILLY